jgi:hypothetical protein
VAIVAEVVAASGCGQYEAAPTDLTAMPKRPEAPGRYLAQALPGRQNPPTFRWHLVVSRPGPERIQTVSRRVGGATRSGSIYRWLPIVSKASWRNC